MRMQYVRLADAASLPLWRRPVALLFLTAFAMPLAFATWSALLNNFVIEAAGFLGAATAVTAWFPAVGGIMTITLLSSIGFHYYETVNQSLQLQWISKDRAPQVIGWL
nr:MFS transporter [Paracoccaceae bacterium]